MKQKFSQSSSDLSNPDSNNEVYYTVEKIIKTRILNGKKECLIKWLGYNSAWNTWEPEENIRTEIYDDNESFDETSISNTSLVQENSTKTVERKHIRKHQKKVNDIMPKLNKKTPIIVSHKISKKRLASILANLAKKQSDLINIKN